MIMADVLAIVFIVLAVLLALPAFWLVTRALFPQHAARSETRLRERPVASFVTGALVSLAAGLVLTVLGNGPGLFKLIAFLGGCTLFGYGLMGAGGLCHTIGERMPSPSDQVQPWRATLRGGIAFELTCLIPLFGWLVLLPASILLGVGANTLAWFGSRKPKAAHPEVAPVQPAAATPPAQPAEVAGTAR